MTKDYYVDELKRLVGCKVVGIIRSTDEYEKYYGLKIYDSRRELRYILWFLRDEEGNGPGTFVVEDYDSSENFEEV